MLPTLALSAQDVNLYSREKEAALGAGLAKEIGRHTTPIDSSAVRDYVTSVGRHFASQLGGTGVNWTFAVVADSLSGRTHEPIALPGGFIFVPASLMLEARNEAELAGMLAHPMVHVAERHGTRTATRGEIANGGSIPLIFMGNWAGATDRDDLLIPAPFLKSWQTFELEADRVAVGLMAVAGYDPGELLFYIDRVQPARTDPPPDRSNLPSHDERIAALQQAIERLHPAMTYSSPNQEFIKIQEEIRRLMPATQARRTPSLLHP